jgi:hypothetical protein
MTDAIGLEARPVEHARSGSTGHERAGGEREPLVSRASR